MLTFCSRFSKMRPNDNFSESHSLGEMVYSGFKQYRLLKYVRCFHAHDVFDGMPQWCSLMFFIENYAWLVQIMILVLVSSWELPLVWVTFIGEMIPFGFKQFLWVGFVWCLRAHNVFDKRPQWCSLTFFFSCFMRIMLGWFELCMWCCCKAAD